MGTMLKVKLRIKQSFLLNFRKYSYTIVKGKIMMDKGNYYRLSVFVMIM